MYLAHPFCSHETKAKSHDTASDWLSIVIFTALSGSIGLLAVSYYCRRPER